MKILRVEPILINTPLDVDGAIPMSKGEPKRDIYTLLVRIETDEGITGFGEAFANLGWMATHAAIEHVVAPRCIGQDASDIATLMHKLSRALYNCGLSGPIVYALSAIDIALWDIAGKQKGLPLYRMLGRNFRRSLPAYASLLHYGAAATVSSQITQALARGYRLIKIHENNPHIIRAARKAAGPDVALMIDCMCPWNLDEARAIAIELEDLNIKWLEEPLYPPDDHAKLAQLRATSTIPIAAGENVSNLVEFRRMFEMKSLGFAQPSVTKVGGVTELGKIFALAETFAVPVVPHSAYFGPGFLASVHACAAAAGTTWIERYYCDFESHPFSDAIHPQNGEIVIPQGPGLGFDPDLRLIERFRVPYRHA